MTVAIELRRNVAADPRPQRHVTAVNRHVRRGARRDIVGFRAERVSFDPYAAQIGDPIELVASQNLLTDRDVGKTLGSILKQDLLVPGEIVSIDGVLLKEFDFVDIGEVIQPAGVVPVVKQLGPERPVFGLTLKMGPLRSL